MSLSVEQLVEAAFIRAFPGQSQAMKALYRYEIESWVAQAMEVLGAEVLDAPDYQLLQRTRLYSLATPYSALQTVNYCQFGPNSLEPVLNDEGYFVGQAGSFAASHEDVLYTGGPSLVANQVVQFQVGTDQAHLGFGLIRHPAPESSYTDPTKYFAVVKVNAGVGDVFHHEGTLAAAAFPNVKPGDFFAFVFAVAGNLTIEQRDADLQVKGSFVVPGPILADVVATAVYFVAAGGMVRPGRWGNPAATPPDGVYRVNLKDCHPFIHSSIWMKGYVAFDTPALSLLSYTPNQTIRELGGRCDTWYFTIENDQLLIFAGAATPPQTLPANAVKITGNVVPLPSDLPRQWHERAIQLCVGIARERVGTLPGKVTDKK
jgi:hypothetical protein